MKEEKKKVTDNTPGTFGAHLLSVMEKEIERNQLRWQKKNLTVRNRRTRRSKYATISTNTRQQLFIEKNIILKGNYVTTLNQIYN